MRAKSIEAAAAADLAIFTAKVRNQTFPVLTSEQLAKLKELQAQHQSLPRKPRIAVDTPNEFSRAQCHGLGCRKASTPPPCVQHGRLLYFALR